MNRRDFSTQLAAATLGLSALGSARAQGGPVEGTNYVKLAQPVPMPSNGKVNIVEFFWYGCPHCFAFEPTLEAWVKTLSPQISFTRAHVAFAALHETHSKVYYTLESMGLVDQMHRKVFNAIHLQHRRLDKEGDIEAFMTENGVDGKKFIEVFRSFAVQSKVRQAKQLSEAYKIDGVPTLGVQGRYWTSVGMAGGPNQTLAVVEFLAHKAGPSR